MKAILILAGSYSSCDATKNIWHDVCLKNNIKFETQNYSESAGKDTATKLNIKSFPAFIINDKVIAVGHPDEQSAGKVIQTLISSA